MIVLFNVKITNQGLSYYPRAQWMPKDDRMNIFKYTLDSYVPFDTLVDKWIFYIEVAPEFQHRQEELEQHITESFPKEKLTLKFSRNYYGRDWRQTFEDLDIKDDDIIWYSGNDDHIFYDYNLDMVESAINVLKNDPDPLSQVYYSHWPEQMRLSYQHQGELTEDGDWIKHVWRTFDSIVMMKGERFRRYWFDQDWKDLPVFRTDALWHKGYELTGPVYSPVREMVRHYDGYGHVGQLENIIPPVQLPIGYFDDNLRVRIGYLNKLEDWVNIHPLAEWILPAHPQGADYRWLPEDLPLFWKSKIKELDVNPELDLEQSKKLRDSIYITATRLPMRCYSFNFTQNNAAPPHWFDKHLRYGKD